LTVQYWLAGAVVIAISSLPAGAELMPQPPVTADAEMPTTVALVETWPNGQTNYELTSPRRASMWTPRFPRVDGFTVPDGGTPVFAVQFVRVLVGRDIKVDVSVLLGSAQQPGVLVASVVVSPGATVVVDELRRFGVQPVTLSMADVAPMTPYLPTVVSVAPEIEIADVEVLNSPYPGYRITLRNLGSKGVSNMHLQSYYGEEKALSALKRADDGRPMMQPGATYTFAMNLTSGRANEFMTPGTWSPRPIDLIEFDSVRWDDGTYTGKPPFPHADALIEGQSGQRLQLRRIVEVLRRSLAGPDSGPALLASARAGIGALVEAEPDQLDTAKLAMQRTKAVVQADIARFERGQSNAARTWLTSQLGRYEAWLRRLSPP
jgi:hypothetical protein